MPTLSAVSSSRRLFASSLPERAVAVLAASLAVAVTAHIAFPLPFTPVPFTLQPLAVLAIGLLLGPVDGGLALLAYLAEGLAGLPVFSPTGPGGLAQLLGPTGGYLMADPVVAFLAGLVTRSFARHTGHYAAALIGCTLATVVLFAAGAGWLAGLHPMSARTLWIAAVAPFLPGEAVKIVVAAGLYRTFANRLPR
jgi:biotin transport system substrate-specific component